MLTDMFHDLVAPVITFAAITIGIMALVRWAGKLPHTEADGRVR